MRKRTSAAGRRFRTLERARRLRCSISNVYLENHLKSNREVRRVRRVRDDGKHPGAIALLLRVSETSRTQMCRSLLMSSIEMTTKRSFAGHPVFAHEAFERDGEAQDSKEAGGSRLVATEPRASFPLPVLRINESGRACCEGRPASRREPRRQAAERRSDLWVQMTCGRQNGGGRGGASFRRA